MDLIDTHLHVIDTGRLSYPWLDQVPALRRDHLLTEWQETARRVGITAALHMEVDVAEGDIAAETDMVADFAAAPGALVIGAISACRPEDPGFAAFLERSLTRRTIKGFRRVLHVVPDDVSRQPLFRDNIRRLAAARRPFDICVLARQLPIAAELADAAPETQFVLDHCGGPDIKGGGFKDWAAGVAEVARRPNVAVKLSGISAYADPGRWTLDDLRPYVEHCIACFGWDRLVWGSDWPVVTQGSSLAVWVAATQALIAGASVEEREKLFFRNARRIWSL